MIIRRMSFPNKQINNKVAYQTLKDCNLLRRENNDVIFVRDLYNGTYQPIEVLSLKPIRLNPQETDREYYLMDFIAHTFYGNIASSAFLKKSNGILKHVSLAPEKLGEILRKSHFESLTSLDEDAIASLLPKENIESEYHFNEDEQILRLLEASKIAIPKVYVLASEEAVAKGSNWLDNVIFLTHKDTIEDLKGEKAISRFTRVSLPDDFILETQVHIELLKHFLGTAYKKEANKCSEIPASAFTNESSFDLYDKDGVQHSWNITFMSTSKDSSLFEELKNCGTEDITIFNEGNVDPQALLGLTIDGETTVIIGDKHIEPTTEDKRITFK